MWPDPRRMLHGPCGLVAYRLGLASCGSCRAHDLHQRMPPYGDVVRAGARGLLTVPSPNITKIGLEPADECVKFQFVESGGVSELITEILLTMRLLIVPWEKATEGTIQSRTSCFIS
jgi:hypothetical protein